MKKFFNSASCVFCASMAIISSSSALAFYLALKSNEHPTGDQLLGGCFFIVFFAILALVSFGASIEEYKQIDNRNNKSKHYEEAIKEYEKMIDNFKKENSIS